MRRVFFVLFILVVAAASGCAISEGLGSLSDSVGSISDSVSSPSKMIKSSSESSSGDDESDDGSETEADTGRYQADVSQLASTFAREGGDIAALQSALAKLASERGVTNWEADSATCVAIGSGFAAAGLQQAPFARYAEQLFGSDRPKQAQLREGFAAGPAS